MGRGLWLSNKIRYKGPKSRRLTGLKGIHMQVLETCPIFRILDEAQARAFYVGYLGFSVDWEHRFEPHLPLYMAVSRGGLILHLSGYRGDAPLHGCLFVRITGLKELHREWSAKPEFALSQGLEPQDWGLELQVTDPFGNRIRFCET